MEKIKSKKITGRTCYTPTKTAHCSKINFNNRTSQAAELPCIRKHSQLPFIKKKNRKISGLQEIEYASEATSSLYGDNFVTGLSKIVGLENYTVVLTRHGKLWTKKTGSK